MNDPGRFELHLVCNICGRTGLQHDPGSTVGACQTYRERQQCRVKQLEEENVQLKETNLRLQEELDSMWKD